VFDAWLFKEDGIFGIKFFFPWLALKFSMVVSALYGTRPLQVPSKMFQQRLRLRKC
jgi:hypothetical protein